MNLQLWGPLPCMLILDSQAPVLTSEVVWALKCPGWERPGTHPPAPWSFRILGSEMGAGLIKS